MGVVQVCSDVPTLHKWVDKISDKLKFEDQELTIFLKNPFSQFLDTTYK